MPPPKRPKNSKRAEPKTTKYFTYTINIHPAEADETGFWVEVPALPGCVTQGETYEEAVAMAKDAIEGYLEALVELGKPIPTEPHPPKKVAVGVQVRSAALA